MSEFAVTKAMKTVIENTIIPKLEEENRELRKYKEYYNNFIASKPIYHCKKCMRRAEGHSSIQYNCYSCLKYLKHRTYDIDKLAIGCSICSPNLAAELQTCSVCLQHICKNHKGRFCQCCGVQFAM